MTPTPMKDLLLLAAIACFALAAAAFFAMLGPSAVVVATPCSAAADGDLTNNTIRCGAPPP